MGGACAGIRAATEQRWGEAERFFQIVLQQEPNSASVYSNLGNVHLSQGHPEAAVLDFTRAIEIAPEVGFWADRLPSCEITLMWHNLPSSGSKICCKQPGEGVIVR